MKKAVLSVGLVVLLMCTLAIGAAAQTVSVGVDRWFATAEIEEEGLSAEASGNLTTITGELRATERIGVNLSYSFGETDNFTADGYELSDSALELGWLQFGADYLVAPGVKVGAGYLTGAMDDRVTEGSGDYGPYAVVPMDASYSEDVLDFSGLYLTASGELPIAQGITLKGEVKYSPFITGEAFDGEEVDITFTAFDIGLGYHLGAFEITGGYRCQSFDVDFDGYPVDFSYSGLYLGAVFRF